jgi:hypothetical protein
MNDSPRSASVKCVMDSHFAILDKDIFLSLVKLTSMHLQRTYFEEFGNLNCLKEWPFTIVRSLYDNITLNQV